MHVPRTPFSVLSEDFAASPYRYFAQLREELPVHYEPGIDSYFLSRHEDVKRVLTDHDAFTTETFQVRAEPVMRGPVLAQMGEPSTPPSGRSSYGPSPAGPWRDRCTPSAPTPPS
ncbi:hypothetical protein [Streptomyces avidinii]